jgi:biotin synthase
MISAGKETGCPAKGIDRSEALELARTEGAELYELFHTACMERLRHRGNRADLCAIINAKSGACPEDCSFCAQSARSRTEAPVYPLLEKEKIIDAARASFKMGIGRFCTVTSGRKPSRDDLHNICGVISAISSIGVKPCATLGMLDRDDLHRLKEAGLNRYHHNLETSEDFFSEVCSTHTYRDKLRTIEAAKSLGLSVCSGGIFGLGESWKDRIEMAFTLRDTGVDSVPLNFLTPVKGTPLGERPLMPALEALKVIAIYRMIMPDREIRVCGGRPVTLKDLSPLIFMAGADGLLVGNYLTTNGEDMEKDLVMIRDMGLCF